MIYHEYRAQPIRVVDGDTLILDVDLGFFGVEGLVEMQDPGFRLPGGETCRGYGGEQENEKQSFHKNLLVGWYTCN